MKILFISLCAGLISSFTLFIGEAIRWIDDIPKPYDDSNMLDVNELKMYSDLHEEDDDG